MSIALNRMLLALLLIFVGVVGISAQDDESEEDLLTLYAEIPQERGEDGAFILGDPEAPVTIIEFADFLCPHCQDYAPTIADFIDEYVATGQARLEYRFFPIIDDQISPLLAQINECTAENDLFWPAHSLLYDLARERQVGADIIEVVANALDIDADELEACVPTAEQYAEDFIYGVGLEVTGTPAIRVRVGEGEPGIISIDGRGYTDGGVPLDVLAEFVESEDPEELVSFDFAAPPPEPQIRNENYLTDDSIVTSDPCGAPCWREIIPGETAWEDAIAILDDDETLADIQLLGQPGQGAVGAAWSPADGETCCQMISNDAGDTVEFILLQTTPELTIEQILEEYGEPEFISFDIFTETQGVATAFYEDVPMLVYVFFAGEAGELMPESEVIGFAYLTSEVMAQAIDTPDSGLIEFAGYGTYADYVTGGEDE